MADLKRAPKPKKWLRSDRFLNREYSWLQFNQRVLEEAANASNPLLERLRFLAIFESNLDEFYMVRVSGLIEQQVTGIYELTPDGLTPEEQLCLIGKAVRPLRKAASDLLANVLLPQLRSDGIEVLSWDELSAKQHKEMETLFRREIFPLCTPLLLAPAHAVPFISNRSLNLAVALADEHGNRMLARVKIPTVVDRFLPVNPKKQQFVLSEDVIRHCLDTLFPGVTILQSHLFRVIRDADVEIRELEAGDLLDAIEQSLKLRRFGDPVLLEVDKTMPAEMVEELRTLLDLDPSDILTVDGMLGLDALHQLAGLDRPKLKFPRHQPYLAECLSPSANLFETLGATEVLLHHPYDSFKPIEEFVGSAAVDPKVVGIKVTLYRVGTPSPIVESLLEAAEAGKQVAVVVELKARFDESNNLIWARALERAGVHVTYGFPELKTHCKLCMVVRREGDELRTYAHIGSGNYNPTTATQYTDIGLLTTDPEITQDVAELFNYLTGFSRQKSFRKLLVAPLALREGVIQRIRREIKSHRANGKGRILLKLNSLVDPEVISALYDASDAGVRCDLIVRSICCLRPGVEGLSENIRVISVVGRFLEHSRMYYFENGGKPELLIGSADMMRRNLERRIEALAPVSDPHQIKVLREQVLEKYWLDNTNSWVMAADGSYKRRSPGGEKPFTVQEYLSRRPLTKELYPC